MNKKYSDKTKEHVLEKYRSGERITVIAKVFEISRTTIYRWIRELNNNLPKRNKKVDMKTFHELERMYQRQKKIIKILQSLPCLVNSPLDIKIETIDKMVSDEFTINTLCEALCVPKDTYPGLSVEHLISIIHLDKQGFAAPSFMQRILRTTK